MALKLYNTLTRQKEDFKPIDPNNVRMYVCGPTVYDYAHIGNARPVVVFDVLFRVLRHLYGDNHVTYARNITDVDDKIMARAKENNESIESLTARTEQDFLSDMKALGALEPTVQPHATAHIAEMIALNEKLIANSNAYVAEGHVLFHTPSMKNYGALSGRNRDDQIAGARVDVAPYKKDPADFVLWKPSSNDQVGWDSPWGRGRPGWHIECSAMAGKHLGATFDIHGGGLDLIFPHHENEIAQSCCANDTDKMANVWMHNGFLTVNSEKMSKSLGNFFTVHELLEKWPGEVIRYALLSGHYRQPLDFTDLLLQQSKQALDRLYGALRDTPPASEQSDDTGLFSLLDDLNTSAALTALHGLAGEANKTRDAKISAQLKTNAAILGLLSADPDQWFQSSKQNALSAAEIEKLIADRTAARANKDFKLSDQIRDELLSNGVLIDDMPGGTRWRYQ